MLMYKIADGCRKIVHLQTHSLLYTIVLDTIHICISTRQKGRQTRTVNSANAALALFGSYTAHNQRRFETDSSSV